MMHIVHHKKGFKYAWSDSSAPVIYLRDIHKLSDTDVLVIPEGFPDIMKTFRYANKVVIALSSSYIFEVMPLGENWKDYGIDWVMVNSKVTKAFIKWSMGINNVCFIGTAIDHELFNYFPGQKKLQIAYINRKDTLSPLIEKIVKSKSDSFNEIQFIKIEGLSINEYAAVLKQSEIYLTTSQSEGFPRSILEAMACGCICIGFDGMGGKDYIVGSGEKQNFILAESMNFIDLSIQLVELIKRIKKQEPIIELIRKNAISTANELSFDIEKSSILDFWRSYFKKELGFRENEK